MRRTGHTVALLVVAGCGAGPVVQTKPELSPSGPRLPEPTSIDPSIRGAAYLTVIANNIQPAWGQFLEDCRLRLPKEHPLNVVSLSATAEIAIARDGRIAHAAIVTPSGNGDFDTAAFDILGDASPLPRPPPELRSDDELVHVRWLFARDRRQAGAATAQVHNVELPLLGVVDRLLKDNGSGRGAETPYNDQSAPRPSGRGAETPRSSGRAAETPYNPLTRAAERVASAPASDPERVVATERVMIAALREGFTSPSTAVRRATVDAVGRAGVLVLAGDVHRLVSPIADEELRIAAIAASAALGDASIAPALVTDLADDLKRRPTVALAKISTLVGFGQAARVGEVIRAELASAAPSPTVIAALALAPDPELAKRLPGWFARGDVRTRAGVCAALPTAAPETATALIARGLRDADATVRAVCADAVTRSKNKPDAALVRRLRELARDRDRTARARAVAALAVVDNTRHDRAFEDPAPEVRLAAVRGAPESELRALAADREPEVRAAAIAALGDRAPDLANRAAADPAPQVRRAAVAAIAEDDLLGRLAVDDADEVATAALVRIAARRGRAALISPFLLQLAHAPAGGERVRIALAWLLAR